MEKCDKAKFIRPFQIRIDCKTLEIKAKKEPHSYINPGFKQS